MSKNKNKKNKAAVNIVGIIALAIIAFFKIPIDDINLSSTDLVENTGLVVKYIDVGQADSSLISCGSNDILIDAGNNDDFKLIEKELKKIDDLEYLILTHPHEDHIGGADDVIYSKWVNADTKIIMPKKTHTTKTFKDVVGAIKSKDLSINEPMVGDVYDLGEAKFMILSPKEGVNYGDNLNNWSVGIKLVYGNTAFVFCGDAEIESEKDILASGIDISADVFKVSHHGSKTSNTDEFLDRINPSYAVFSCGIDNDYGHPHREIVEAIKERHINYFRTDQLGTITITSDGSNIEVK